MLILKGLRQQLCVTARVLTYFTFPSSTPSLFYSLYITPFLYIIPSLCLFPFLYLSFPQTPFKYLWNTFLNNFVLYKEFKGRTNSSYLTKSFHIFVCYSLYLSTSLYISLPLSLSPSPHIYFPHIPSSINKLFAFHSNRFSQRWLSKVPAVKFPQTCSSLNCH